MWEIKFTVYFVLVLPLLRKEGMMDTKFPNSLIRCIAALVLLFLLVDAAPGSVYPAHAAAGIITRVSVDSSGTQANGGSRRTGISDDGRYVAFGSDASNLVSEDTNGTGDIFIHDRSTGVTTRVSVRSNGAQANGGSSSPAISGDGRFVAFYSDASDLLNGDTNGFADIFVHDRQTGQTTRVSVSSSGVEANAPPPDDYVVVSISDEGRFVAFYSDASNLVDGDTNNETDIFVHDLQTGRTVRASVASDGAEANGSSSYPNISGDGRYVTFSSGATNLVPGDTNGKADVFVRDLQAGTTTRVSVNSRGEQAEGGGSSPDISGDGRYVVFLSASGNLDPRADEYNKDLVYVHDRQGGQTTLASVYSEGGLLTVGLLDQPAISRDGRYVAFSFYDKGENQGIMDIWVRDLQSGISIEAAAGNASSFGSSLSASGSVVAFWSGATNLVSGDTNESADAFAAEVSFGAERNPTVASAAPDCGLSTPVCTYPTPSTVSFIVNFSEQVTGVTADDFSLAMLDGLTGATITGVNGYGSQYMVSVNTGTGEGKLRLNVLDNDSILDSALNPLGGAGAGNGDFTSGKLYWIDKTVPVVTSITRTDPNPTAAAEVRFTVDFSEVVGLVKISDFVLSTSGNITGAAVTAISPREDEFIGASTYTVTVSTGMGDGTLRLDLIDNDTIGDWDSPIPLGGTGVGNGNFTMGEIYTITKSAPIVPSVASVLRADPNPTAGDLVSFSVTFSEPVSGVDASDFSIATTGNLSGALVANLTGSGNTYTILAATGSGDGGLRLDVLDDDSITNATGVPLGGTGPGNGAFTGGEAYTVDKTAPTVTASLRADPNPTIAASVNFTVVFSEPVTGVEAGDFFVATTGSISGAGISAVNGSGYLYTVSVGTGSGDGTLRLDVLDNDSILDASNLALAGPGIGNGNFTTGEEFTLTRLPVNKITETIRSNGANDGWVLESGEDSNQGGFKDAYSRTLVLGDDPADRQFRSILHFPTDYLPDNAVITRALLMLKGEGVAGTNPFETHQNIVVDIRSGAFGFIGPFPYRGLQVSDFQSPAHRDAVGIIQNNPLNGWYWTWLDPAAFEYIKLNGITQFRLRFQLDDNDNMQYDYIRFYSGDYDGLADRPRLVVEYYTR
jgi:hypothetical protein